MTPTSVKVACVKRFKPKAPEVKQISEFKQAKRKSLFENLTGVNLKTFSALSPSFRRRCFNEGLLSTF